MARTSPTRREIFMIFNKNWHVWHRRGEAHRDTCVSVEGPTINTAHAAPSEATVSIGAKAVAYCDLIATKAKIIHITHTDLKVMLDRDTNGYGSPFMSKRNNFFHGPRLLECIDQGGNHPPVRSISPCRKHARRWMVNSRPRLGRRVS